MADGTSKRRPKLEPLKVSCDQCDCENGLHCFRTSKKKAKHPKGACQECGLELVAWDRVKRRDQNDVAHTIDALKNEWIRHHFWHEPIDQRARNHALRKGRAGIRLAAENRIRKSVGVKTALDGRQTPWEGNTIYYAQHATACCCRRCMDYWHGIPEDHVLTDDEIGYFAELCTRFVFERLPELPELGQRVPPIRHQRGAA